jgi:hypothetical protein
MAKRKRLGLADGEQTSYDKAAQALWREPPRKLDPALPGGVDEPGDSNRLSLGLASFVHHEYAELAGGATRHP